MKRTNQKSSNGELRIEKSINVQPKCSTPTLQSVINAAFREAKKKFGESKKQLKSDDYVLAQMRGYAPWPSKIVDFTKNGQRAKCFFYGTRNFGMVETNQIIPFTDAVELVRLINMRNPMNYAKGVRELEIDLGIPSNSSVLRELAAIN